MYRVTKSAILASLSLAAVLATGPAKAAVTPEIRTSPSNMVTGCMQPERMMDFVRERNKKLPPQFADLASYYKQHGEQLGIRWDYAFFQMLVETNYLRFHAPNGRQGDVSPRQNNFAGLGATGGGVPGESFPDPSTGVLAHLQHIMMYSGERVQNPVAKRTRDVQDWNLILPWAQAFNRPITYTDLTTKWSPGDKGYSNDIEYVANNYRAKYCKPGLEQLQTADKSQTPVDNRGYVSKSVDVAEGTAADLSASVTNQAGLAESEAEKRAAIQQKMAAVAPSKLGKVLPCKVWTASFGGDKGVLIRSTKGSLVHYTALSVHQEREEKQLQAFIDAYAKGGEPIGEYRNHGAAVTKAFELCPASK